MIEETFTYSDFVIKEKTPSKIRHGYNHVLEVGFMCPSCEQEHDHLEHGKSIFCFCGVHLTRYGNALECKKNSKTQELAETISGKLSGSWINYIFGNDA